MIDINGHKYKLCLVDTNIVSELVKRPDPVARNFFSLLKPDRYIPCLSIFTILELRQNQSGYNQFLKYFSVLPCMILKSLDQLFAEEVDSYPNPENISPILIGSSGALAPKKMKLKNILNTAFALPEIQKHEHYWNAGKTDIVEGIQGLVKNYPPKQSKYSKSEIREFLEMAVFEQIVYRAPEFAKRLIGRGEAVSIDAFLSQKMAAFTVFYKFYQDQRLILESDAFDIIISAATPYMDAIVTENHQADALRKISQQDSFLDQVEVFKLKDLLKSS